VIRRALVLVGVTAAAAGCGSSASPSTTSSSGSLGGIGLYHPAVRGDRVQVDFAVMTGFPNSQDDRAERNHRFHWVSLRLAGRTAVATHQSQTVDKTGDVVDTGTGGKSAWRDRWRAELPALALASAPARTPMTVRACDRAPGKGVHCEKRTIDVCVRSGRLRGEVTTGSPPTPAPRGTGGGILDYAKDFSCRRPVFNGGQLNSISDPDPNPDFE
jgi:hypothetical protein